ncbi:MAG TPA: SDR family NAD(P)-dependent oxidoreductase [Blastocatellia bacterium]|nr:SDR family NAD(P)-dependent oxidoreductase [Blastocatellia bacterium]
MKTLSGKIALVTGGGRGIGEACAVALAEAGADVVVCSRSSAEIEAVAGRIRATGQRALAVVCNVTDADQVRRMAEEVNSQFGAVEILVNNAGLGRSHRFLDHPDELWDQMLAVNLTGVYYVTKAFIPKMIEARRGRIINIASVMSKIGGKYVAAYTAAKHGLLGLTRALAVELAGYNITANAICPGYVDTPMTDDNVANIVSKTGMPEAEARIALEKLNPQNRLIEVGEVAAVVMTLASDIAQGINGQAINIDGGAVMF